MRTSQVLFASSLRGALCRCLRSRRVSAPGSPYPPSIEHIACPFFPLATASLHNNKVALLCKCFFLDGSAPIRVTFSHLPFCFACLRLGYFVFWFFFGLPHSSMYAPIYIPIHGLSARRATYFMALLYFVWHIIFVPPSVPCLGVRKTEGAVIWGWESGVLLRAWGMSFPLFPC